jgi:hypothetical protein
LIQYPADAVAARHIRDWQGVNLFEKRVFMVFLPEERSNHIKEALVKGVPVGLAVQKKHEV